MGLRDLETERAKTEFNRRAANVASVLNHGIYGYSTAVTTLKNLTSTSLRYSDGFRPSESLDYLALKNDWDSMKIYFNQMAKDAGNSFPGLIGLGWVLSVPDSELDDVTLAGKFLIAPEFKIRQFSGNDLVDVESRLEHFPVFYIEPLEQNMVALGIDLASSNVTHSAIVKARDTGTTVSTRPIHWIKQQTGKHGLLVFDSVYLSDAPSESVEQRRANLHSVSFAIILIDDMLESAMRGLNEDGVDYFIYAQAEDPNLEIPVASPIYISDNDPETIEELQECATHTGIQWRSNLDVMGRDWTLYSYPHDGFITDFRTSGPLIALCTGISFTLLLAYYLFHTAGRTQRVEALVSERTLELSLANTTLQQEMANRLESDQQRQDLELQLLHTQKMESVGQLAGGVAHDFNNLLQAILGYSELAMGTTTPGTPAHNDLRNIMEAGERARVLVQQLLAFSRQQLLKLTDVQLVSIVDDLTQMIRRVIGEHIILEVNHDSDLDLIHADRGQIEQIIINLCVNARDAMPGGGSLTIRTANKTLDEEFCSTQVWASPGRHVTLEISDTGFGIDDDVQPRIFEPFFTTKELGKGTGLGLSTVFGIVRQHHGIIELESTIGIGSTFRIYFPESTTRNIEKPVVKSDYSGGGTETILLVDDEKMVRDVGLAVLRNAGYTVLTASDGVEAIDVFNQHAKSIDLALLDVVMPKLGGKAVADHILKERPGTPILFCSGYSNESIHTGFELADRMQLLQKPYRRSDLLQKVREVIENG